MMRRVGGQIASFHKLRLDVPKTYHPRKHSWAEWSQRARPYLALSGRGLHQLIVWAEGEAEIATAGVQDQE
eukprot:4243961-Lingulodinium_polyedra.AAC.1